MAIKFGLNLDKDPVINISIQKIKKFWILSEIMHYFVTEIMEAY